MKNFIFILSILLTFSCKKNTEKTNPIIENISESVYASGVVKGKNQYQVYSTVNGLIEEIYVTEGDTIKKGDALMKVLNETSKLNALNARLNEVNSTIYANADKLNEAKATLEFSLNKMKNDSLLLMRQKNLWSQSIGSSNDLEQKQLAYSNSNTNAKVAKLRYSDLKRQLEFASNQSKTNLKISTSIEDDYIIKAEASGIVYKVLKENGEIANTINPVAIIGDASEFLIELKVDEFDIARIRVGQKVLLTMDSYKGEIFKASVQKIEPLMDESSRSFTVKAYFDTKPPVLYPNLTIEANIIIFTKEKVLTIPRSYLINDSTVMIKKDELRKVVTGLKDYQKVEIKSGLSVNDMIYKLIQ